MGYKHMIDVDWKNAGSLFINGDCMEYMKTMPDKCVELAICDPPYGGNDAIGLTDNASMQKQATLRTQYRQFENVAPSNEYFDELRRVSRNQIIWGVNFFDVLGLSGGRIVWDKKGTAFGRAEEAYCSMTRSVNIFEYTWNGMIQQNMKDKEHRIHPTQKPIALYKWLLSNYAKPGDKILDTHVGSASSLIACHQMGFEYWGFELDTDYYNAATERLNKVKAQVSMTELIEQVIPEQVTIGGEYGH